MQDTNKILETWFDLISHNENFINALVREISPYLSKNSGDFSFVFFKESLQKFPSLTLVKAIFTNFNLLKNRQNKTELIEYILKCLKNIEKIDSEIIFFLTKNLDLIENESFLKFLENSFHKNKFTENVEKSYKCKVCGYNSSNLYWQCISCKSWESFI